MLESLQKPENRWRACQYNLFLGKNIVCSIFFIFAPEKLAKSRSRTREIRHSQKWTKYCIRPIGVSGTPINYISLEAEWKIMRFEGF